jgi:epoxyqueuosine reductase
MTVTTKAQALLSELVSRGLEPEAIAFASAERYAARRAASKAAPQLPSPDKLFAGYPGAVVVALPYDPRPADPPPGIALPLAVGAFAASHRYATLARILKAAALAFAKERGYARRDFRVAVNSSLHEKALAAASGLAFLGRSSLALTKAYGPACVLGVLLLPFDPFDAPAPGEAASVGGVPGATSDADLAPRLRPGALCGSCRACALACPTGAIHPAAAEAAASSLELSLCIQYWASRGDAGADAARPPESVLKAWGSRLYGCDECVRACPHSAGAYRARGQGIGAVSPAARVDSLAADGERVPGPYVDWLWLRGASEGEIKSYFKGSALGFAWLGPAAIHRNACRAAALPHAAALGVKESPGI